MFGLFKPKEPKRPDYWYQRGYADAMNDLVRGGSKDTLEQLAAMAPTPEHTNGINAALADWSKYQTT